jgi:hypothetical protein
VLLSIVPSQADRFEGAGCPLKEEKIVRQNDATASADGDRDVNYGTANTPRGQLNGFYIGSDKAAVRLNLNDGTANGTLGLYL